MISIKTSTNVSVTALALEDYWEFFQINECAAYGIRNFPTTGVLGLGCGDYWDQDYRYYLAKAIQKAEERIEADRWLGFPLKRKHYSRQFDYKTPASLGLHTRGVGVETWTAVNTVALTLSEIDGTINDPVEFTIAVDFTDINELVIIRPGTTYTLIKPSAVTISAGVATVQIPRCRLLKSSFFLNYKNANERPNYNTDANFLDEIDVYRNYLDTTTGANLVWWKHSGDVCNCPGVSISDCGDGIQTCSDVRQLACAYVRNQRMGEVTFSPASYSGGWVNQAIAVKRKPDGLEVNYMRGRYDRYDEMESSITRAVIAIAHNNLPRNYCSCDQQTLYYQDDTRPLEPPIRLGLGRSTWGLYEAEQILREFDAKREGYGGGLF